jgi:hypothetical protein
MLSAIFNFLKTDFNEQYTCVKLWFELWEAAPEMQQKKPKLPLQPRNQTAAVPVQKPVLTTSTQNKASQVVCQEYVDLFWSITTLLIMN